MLPIKRLSVTLLLTIWLTLGLIKTSSIRADAGAGDSDLGETSEPAKHPAKDRIYISPKIKQDKPEELFLYESFDDEQQFGAKWMQSDDPKYTGRWKLNSGLDRPEADSQLLLPLKARHYAISSKLNQPFKFTQDKPLIVQYEVQFREGLDCGGAYVKLLRGSAINDLKKLTDKTPFTVMFGPDKCGSESKLHFIIQYLNPKTQEYSERHWKQAKSISSLGSAFSDKKSHLFKLVLEPNNNFEVFLDDKSVGKGSLLEDLDPPINPPKEIVDPNDEKPADWDERPQIDDPDAKKPDDWDEDAPKTIEDPNAIKPDDWLENEPQNIPDPNVKKPEDWEEMDGEWEAPLIDNPVCAKAAGCGEWKPPVIANPNFKGKWKPSKIDNPKYKGKWTPRMIPNPDYFYDEKPFASLDSIGAASFELWSMADNLAFDNLIITSDIESADLIKLLTWQINKDEADASSPSLLTRAMHYLKVQPWLWAVLVLAVALPLFLFISYCCDTKRGRRSDGPTDDAARRKKADESKPDSKGDKNDTEAAKSSKEAADEDEEEDEEEEDDDDDDNDADKDDDDDEEEVEADEKQAGDKATSKRQVRQRKKN